MKPQEALHFYQEKDKKKPKYIGHDYMIFQKYDGWYGYLEDGKIYSRAGRVIPSLKHLKMPKLSGRVVFEILVRGVSEFHILNGILNRKSRCEFAYFKAHDYISEQYPTNFAARFKLLTALDCRLGFGRIPKYNISLAKPLGTSDNPAVWQQAAEQVWSMNGEGVILKRLDATYEAGKRNFNLMKIKEELTLDLLVVGMAMGEGKYHSTLGKLILRDKSGKEHRVSGMTDAQRHEWWRAPKGTMKCPHPVMGRVVEVKAMKQLKDGSLREPRFKAIRFDKLPAEID